MINYAFITATCDRCLDTTDPIGLCPLAGGGWDERYIEKKLQRWGWRVSKTETICDNCVHDEECDEMHEDKEDEDTN